MALSETAALVSSLELQDKFSKTVGKYEKSLGSMERKTGTFDKVLGQTNKGLGTLAGNLGRIAAIGVGAAVAGLVFSVKAASDLEESLSKVVVVFGDLSDETIAWAEDAASAFGQSTQQALEAAGTFGNLFQAFGVGQAPAQEMSTTLVELAADLASFNNTSIDDAILAIRSGLSGETEPLKRFGVALTEDRLKLKALALGLISTTKTALTPAAKAQAAYALILEDTVLAQGDFQRTSGGLANQQRILRANLQNTAATIGTALLPKITELAVKFNVLLTENQDVITDLANKLPGLFDTVAAIVMNLPWEAMGTAFGIMGEGLIAILDTFAKFPPELQTTIIALAGVNKLTGGAVASIASSLATGLIKGVLGITAGTVHITAGTVTGGAGGTVVGPAGGGVRQTGANIIRVVGTAAIFSGIAVALGELVAQNVTRPANPTQFDFNAVAGASGLFNRPEEADALVRRLSNELGITQTEIKETIVEAIVNNGLTFEEVIRGLEGKLVRPAEDTAARARESLNQDHIQTAQLHNNLLAIRDADRERSAEAARNLQAQSAAQVKLQQIADKDFSPTVSVAVTSNVTISDIQRKITSQQIAIGKGFQEFE